MNNKITSRKKSRKFLFQKLFSDSYHKNDKELFNNAFIIDSYKGNLDEEYLNDMEELIKSKQPELVKILELYAPKFSPDKMDLTYLIPILIGATEMLWFSGEIPAKVSINEAIELTKVFGTDTGKKIVNGVLNNIYKNIDSLKIELENLNIENKTIFF